VRELVASNDRAAAAIAAGYSPARASITAYELLQRPNVAKAHAEAMRRVRDEVEQATGVTLANTVQMIAKLAFFDPRKFFKPDGSPIPINELDPDTAAALAGIEVLEEFKGAGADRVFVGYTKKFKLIERVKSLDMLMKHLGGYEKDNSQKGTAEAQALAELHAFITGVHASEASRIKPAAPTGG
jgi:phage terminase small subunit